ncbi:MAG: biotin transporter BioY, partial [Candidatus Theseobacter exili]|nr:biotin transporter BioY [Candidatus Theseobacter exili]
MSQTVTVASLFRPSTARYSILYNLALILGGSFFIALSAQISILMPFSPVPVTGQTFAVLMVGALMGSRLGVLCVSTYLLEGMMGLPVFSYAHGGLIYLAGPTGGYLIGFIFAAAITGFLSEIGWDRKVTTMVLSMFFGTLAIYVSGVIWL